MELPKHYLKTDILNVHIKDVYELKITKKMKNYINGHDYKNYIDTKKILTFY